MTGRMEDIEDMELADGGHREGGELCATIESGKNMLATVSPGKVDNGDYQVSAARSHGPNALQHQACRSIYLQYVALPDSCSKQNRKATYREKKLPSQGKQSTGVLLLYG